MYVRLCGNKGPDGAWCGFFLPTRAVMTEMEWAELNAYVKKHEREECRYGRAGSNYHRDH